MAVRFPGDLGIYKRKAGCYRAWVKRPGQHSQLIGFKRPTYADSLRDLVTWLKRQGYEWRETWEFFR